MTKTKSHGLIRRVLKITAMATLALVTLVAILCYSLRDEILDKVTTLSRDRLAEKGLYIDYASNRLSWNRGVVLSDLQLYQDAQRTQRVGLLEDIAIRIPLNEIFGSEPRLIFTSKNGNLQLDSSSGSLNLTNVSFHLISSRESLEIEHIEGNLNGLRITTEGLILLEKRDQSERFYLPDFTPIVDAAQWVEFQQGNPTLALQVHSRDHAKNGTDIHALLIGDSFKWKRLTFDSAHIRAKLSDGAVSLPEISFNCYDGNLSGALVIDYKNRKIQVGKFHSTANPFQLIDAAMGESHLKSFRTLGTTTIDGENLVIDLGDFTKSTGTLSVTSTEGITIPSGDKNIPLRNFDADLTYKSGTLEIDAKHLDLNRLSLGHTRLQAKMAKGSIEISEASLDCYEGNLSGSLEIDHEKGKLRISKLKSTVNPFHLIDAVIDEPRLKSFKALGATTISGENLVVDLEDFTRSNGTLSVTSSEGILIPSGKNGIPLRDFDCDLTYGAGTLEIDAKHLTLNHLSLGQTHLHARLAEGIVEVPKLSLDCFEGNLSGAMEIDYKSGKLRISKLASTVNPFQLIDAIMDKPALRSYKLLGTTTITGEQLVIDLEDFTQSTGTLSIASTAGILIPSDKDGIPLRNFEGDLSYDSGTIKIDAKHLELNHISFGHSQIEARLAEDAVEVPDFSLDCFEGNLKGAMVIDHENGKLRFSKITSTANPFRLVEGIKGKPSLSSFRVLGTTTLEGQNLIIDLHEFSRSTGSLSVSSPAGIVIPLGEVEVPLKKFSGGLKIATGDLTIDGKQFTLYGGNGSGSYKMPLSPSFRYQIEIKADDSSLKEAGRAFGWGDELAGTFHTAFKGGGASGFKSHYGKGSLRIEDGKFYAIPVIGSFRALLTQKSPRFGMDKAGDLETSYTLKDGIIHSSDFRIESAATRLFAKGQVNLDQKSLDVDVRANLKGIVGIATGIVSHILSYHGTGPLSSVQWKLASAEGISGGLESTADGLGDLFKGVGEATGKLFNKNPKDQPDSKGE